MSFSHFDRLNIATDIVRGGEYGQAGK